jgi:WD40 repeat protein/tRNA A-37 threonylcarbamoyl transferase component Bud32/tetratricopeptide (TPR) repeat protein
MPPAHEPLPPQLEQLVNAFEDAWDSGSRPALDAFLPAAENDRLGVLIELAHIDLERQLKAGLPARVETYLERYPELAADRAVALDLIAAEHRLRKRTEPELGLGEYRRRFPQYAEDLPARLAEDSERTQTYVTGERPGDAGSTVDGDSKPSTREGPRAGTRPDVPLPHVPGYEVLGVLGRGGMGMVLKARHTVLGRLSAIKVPLPHHLTSAEARERFLREARSAARLRHPHICPIYEVGEADGLPFLIMGFIQGETLRDRARRAPPSPRDAAAIVGVLARAVHYAHEQGVIHRDIKPANVLIDAETHQPILMDFGLAKELGEDASQLTHSGQIMGTPAYMAPEQAAGRLDHIGPTTDVYALGAVLYELLTGRPPFAGGTAEVLHKLQTEDPPPPRKLVPRLHRDLETVCLKALAKEPHRRYESALALAEDLERFSTGEAIRARREGLAARLWRRARRSPLTVAAGLALLLAVGAAGLLVWHYLEVRRVEDADARVQREIGAIDATPASVARAETALDELAALSPEQAAARRKALHEKLAEVIDALLRRDILRDKDKKRLEAGLDLLAARAPALEADLRAGWKQRYTGFDKVFHVTADSPKADRDEVDPAGRLRPDGKALVVAGPAGAPAGKQRELVTLLTRVPCTGNAKLQATLEGPWGTGAEVGLLLHAGGGHAGAVLAASFAPDGRLLATAGDDGSVRLWDAATAEELTVLPGHKGLAFAVRFAPDGKTLASGGSDGKVRIWEARSGKELAALDACTGAVLALAYSPDGAALASAGGTWGKPDVLKVWDVAARRERFAARSHKDAVASLAFSPDGRLLASGEQQGGLVKLWDWRAGKETATLDGDGNQLTTVAFSPDSRTLAASSSRGKVRLWDVATWRLRAELEAFSAGAYGLSFAPDGRTLAAGYDGGHIKVWDLATQQIRASLSGHDHRVTVVQFSPDGAALLSATPSGEVKLWDVDAERERLFLAGRGYDFLLGGGTSGKGPAPAGGRLPAAIFRNGVRQREEQMPVRGERLTLTATRDGDRLILQVNDRPPLVFRDVMPGGPRGGVFGLRLPRGVRLLDLQAFRQPPPARPSALERGDDLLARQQYTEALGWYEGQIRAGVSDPEALREARCKAGLCLVALAQPERAAELFAMVAAEGGRPGEVWPLVATFQLWLLHLQQDRYQEAEALFTEVRTRYTRFEDVATIIPDDVRARILRAYERLHRPTTFLFFDPRVVGPLERAVQVADLFRAAPGYRVRLRHRLVWAYHLSRQREEAVATAGQALRLLDGDAAAKLLGLSEYVWLTRLGEGPERALAEVETRLAEARAAGGGGAEPWLLVERARLHAALGEPDKAEKDMKEFFGLSTRGMPYEYWCAACLLHGFLREQAGDRAGALAAWERGRFPSWPGRRADVAGDIPGSVIPVIYNLLLGSLTGTTSDAEARASLERLAGPVGADSPHVRLLKVANIPASVYREMGQTRRGREAIRKVAFREVSQPELVRTPVLLLTVEFFHQGALPGPLPADKEDVIWQAVEGSLDAYSRGELKMEHLNHLGVAWKARGEILGLGWKGVKGSLSPALRGPLAYLLGHRHLIRGKRADAEAFFETALADAPAGSALQRLSREELKRLKGK